MWVPAEGPHDKWHYDRQPLPQGPLLLVGDVGVDGAQGVWGFGAVLATLVGYVLWEATTWMYLEGGAWTTLLEATIIHEAVGAVMERAQHGGEVPKLYRFADNLSAVRRLLPRPIVALICDV